MKSLILDLVVDERNKSVVHGIVANFYKKKATAKIVRRLALPNLSTSVALIYKSNSISTPFELKSKLNAVNVSVACGEQGICMLGLPLLRLPPSFNALFLIPLFLIVLLTLW